MTEWPADIIERINHRTIYLWIVPAKVEGEWRWKAGPPLRHPVQQDHQTVSGTPGSATVKVLRGLRLRGDAFDFEVELAEDRTRHFPAAWAASDRAAQGCGAAGSLAGGPHHSTGQGSR